MKKKNIVNKEVDLEEIAKRWSVLMEEVKDYLDNHYPRLYSPGGIYHVPTKHKGLRLDNIEYLEGKGQNVN
jgi:hypothetical protein